MATLRITGVPPLDGDYTLDIATFTNRELHTIKEISGVRAGELKEAMEAADNDLVVAFAVIALRRAGKQANAEQLWDADLGAISVDLGSGGEVEQRPPGSASPSGNENVSAVNDAHNASTTRSGADSDPIGATPPNGPSPTGLRGLETSAESRSEMLAS